MLIKVLFLICDLDNDGKINFNEYLKIFEYLLGNDFSREEIRDICEKTMLEYSSDKALTLEEFVKIMD